jgi:glutamine amidotransferase PdxT
MKIGVLAVEVDRNAYGRQVASFGADLELDGEPVLLRQRFLDLVREETNVGA